MTSWQQTCLFKNLPTMGEKWASYKNQFKNEKQWIICSDYCWPKEKGRAKTVVFTIFPYIDIDTFKENIRKYIPHDLKDCNNISQSTIDFIKKMPHFFHICIEIEDADKLIDLISIKQLSDNLDFLINNNTKTNETLLKRCKLFRQSLSRKEQPISILSQLFFISHTLSEILVFLLEDVDVDKVLWISDRDSIISFKNGIIFDLVFMKYRYRAQQLKLKTKNNFFHCVTEDNNSFDFDEFIRMPDILAGALSTLVFNTMQFVGAKKHQDIIQQIIAGHPFICTLLINLSNNSEEPLKEVTITPLPTNTPPQA